jgi:hypothetical protein
MDDWSLLPSRNAVGEPAPNLTSTMTATTPPARLTRPRQAPTPGADHPRLQNTARDPAGLAWELDNQAGAKPQNPNNPGHHAPSRHMHTNPHDKRPTNALYNPRPFMDDTGRLLRPDRTNTTRRFIAFVPGSISHPNWVTTPRGAGAE